MSPASGEPEAPLLAEIAAGSETAVETLLERYRPLVWSIVRKQVPASAVEDAVQEVFLDVWRSAARFDPNIASERTFIATIARRRSVDNRRRAGRIPPPDELPEEVPDDLDALEAIDLADEASLVLQKVELLRPVEQRVLRLAVFHDLSHAEIAAQAGLPLGTVKSQLRRGMKRLRDLLPAPPDPDET
ncbi:MAG: sigma-70 family RNA polymerase sigma factor [Planctomycetota bacterium]